MLREGNSDRRVALAVKEYAKAHPHSMGQWDSGSKTCVAHMSSNDFYGTEQSCVAEKEGSVQIILTTQAGEKVVLKDRVRLLKGEVFDSAVMSQKALGDFYKASIQKAKDQGLLLSLHLKATMMKVSDPVMFGHAVMVYFDQVFQKHQDTFNQLGVNPRNGLGDVYSKIESLSPVKRDEIKADIAAVYEAQPALAMVDSDKGITNLHVPSDVIIDASMPAAIRSSGMMWGPDGKLQDTLMMIPDRSYAGIYQETIDFCKQHGAFKVSEMGSVANVGLMAQKAEEYGSHDKTFEAPGAGQIRIKDLSSGAVLLEHTVEEVRGFACLPQGALRLQGQASAEV